MGCYNLFNNNNNRVSYPLNGKQKEARAHGHFQKRNFMYFGFVYVLSTFKDGKGPKNVNRKRMKIKRKGEG